MKTQAEIQKAHDQLVAVITDELPILNSYLDRLALRAAADALCWVLDHDDNQTFAANLTKLDAEARALGLVLIEKENTHGPNPS